MPTELSRRGFLGAGLLVGGLVLAGCSREEFEQLRPRETPDADGRRWFTPAEAVTVDAIIARLIPGDASDPGAREADVLTFIDRKLAENPVFAQPVYLDPPYVVVLREGEAAPPGADLTVTEDQLYRYGYQSGLLPHQVYREGLPQLDEYSRSRAGAPFAELDAASQDAILDTLSSSYRSLNSPEGTGASGTGAEVSEVDTAFGDPSAGAFFGTVWTDTIEGFFADPAYGGNRDLAGWRLIGYPGAQRAYSPAELLRGTRRTIQPMDHLPEMNPDRQGDGHGDHGHGDPALIQPHGGVVEA